MSEITKAKPQGLKEEWKEIPGLSGAYLASSMGEIKSLPRLAADDRKIKGRLMRLQKTTSGYLFFAARSKTFSGPILVHRAVLSAFTGGMEQLDVNHINGIKHDNRAANLEWLTRSGNLLHAANTGLKPVGVQSHLAKLSEDNVREIRQLLTIGKPQTEIAALFGVTQTAISKIKTLKKWKQLV